MEKSVTKRDFEGFRPGQEVLEEIYNKLVTAQFEEMVIEELTELQIQ